MKNRLYEAILLFFTASWGLSFLLTKDVLRELSIFNFLGLRFLLAFLCSGLIFFRSMKSLDMKTIKSSVLAGSVLFLSFAFQTIGVDYSSASKVAFITGLSVVLVPIFSSMIFKEKLSKSVWFGAILACMGLAMMTIEGMSFKLQLGDLAALIGAISFAIYMILVEHHTKKVNSINFAVLQLGVVAAMSLIISGLSGGIEIPKETSSWVGLSILATVCTSGAYIAQNILQRYISAPKTALIYSTEPIFAGFFGVVLWHETMSTMAIIGAVLIFLGMICTEIMGETVKN